VEYQDLLFDAGLSLYRPVVAVADPAEAYDDWPCEDT